MIDHSQYQTPLGARYASKEMSYLFSSQFKHRTWRHLWVALAKAEKKLGLPISKEQIEEMQRHIDDIDFAKVAEYEKTLRHDVMAHIHAYGEQCPMAKGIIHLGATSSYVTDNTDLIQMQQGLKLLQSKCIQVLRNLAGFAEKYADLPCLSYTHFQAAQPTTVGKRACLWIQDLLLDFHDLTARLEDFRFLGVKGATGTQASFFALFENNSEKVHQLETLVAAEMGWAHLFPVASQTYPRKQDMRLLSVLCGLGASAHKFATDIRLLAHDKEIEEPFAQKQIGSSAMPYKRNPMRCERLCALARFLMSLNENPAYTAATQWLERSLDDSANRRLALSEAFLTADAILNLLIDVTAGLVVYPQVIRKHLDEELPFLATENILMAAVKKGKDRQQVHEHLRTHSQAAAQKIKEKGESNDLLERIGQDSAFGLSENELAALLQPKHFIGRAAEQTEEFLRKEIAPLLEHYRELRPASTPIEV